jgi:hypothetical protein
MKLYIPDWLIIAGAIGQMFTAIIYPYIRHVVFDWYNDIKKLKPLNQEIAKTYGRYIQGLNFSFGFSCINRPYRCLLDRESHYPVFLLPDVPDTKESYFQNW